MLPPLHDGCRQGRHAIEFNAGQPGLLDRPRARQFGSTPLALSVGAAPGPLRKRISALAASGSLADAPRPAAKPILVCSSSGIGPTTSTPGTSTRRVATTTTMSASPLAPTSTVSSAFIGRSLDFISAAIPMRSSRLTKYNPLAPLPG